MASRTSFWGPKVRQARAYLAGRVSPAEHAELASWLTPAQVGLFERMHRADQRHGLDVVASLRARDVDDPDLLLAGLFHDAGKGPGVGLVPRVIHALGVRYGRWIPRTAAYLPGLAGPLRRMDEHVERSSILARAAGCPSRTVDLIRGRAGLYDERAAELLRLADDAS